MNRIGVVSIAAALIGVACTAPVAHDAVEDDKASEDWAAEPDFDTTGTWRCDYDAWIQIEEDGTVRGTVASRSAERMWAESKPHADALVTDTRVRFHLDPTEYEPLYRSGRRSGEHHGAVQAHGRGAVQVETREGIHPVVDLATTGMIRGHLRGSHANREDGLRIDGEDVFGGSIVLVKDETGRSAGARMGIWQVHSGDWDRLYEPHFPQTAVVQQGDANAGRGFQFHSGGVVEEVDSVRDLRVAPEVTDAEQVAYDMVRFERLGHFIKASWSRNGRELARVEATGCRHERN